MIFILSVVYMFFPDFAFAQTARGSKSMEVSQRALRILGDVVPAPVQQLFDVDDSRPNRDGKGDPVERDLQQKAPTPRRKRDF